MPAGCNITPTKSNDTTCSALRFYVYVPRRDRHIGPENTSALIFRLLDVRAESLQVQNILGM